MKRNIISESFFLEERIEKCFFYVGFVLLILSAFFSEGYYHFDEHYQIVEFAQFKAGLIKETDLPWEYKAQIRPGVQPIIFYVVLRVSSVFSMNDPYTIALLPRLITACLSFIAIFLFYRESKSHFPRKFHIIYLTLSLFIWYLPMVAVRFSSESWAGIFILFAVSAAIKLTRLKTPGVALIFGICCGVSFVCRFQMGICVTCCFAWLFFVGKADVKNIILAAVAFLLPLLFLVISDKWLYGQWLFTPWNYLNVNILKDAASSFGVQPWDYYLNVILLAPTILLGIPLSIGLVLLLLKDNKSIITWIIWPFLIMHSCIPHKEDRFLFPLILFSSYVILFLFTTILKQLNYCRVKSYFYFSFFSIIRMFIFCCTFLFFVVSTTPMSKTKDLTRFIFNEYRGKQVLLLHPTGSNPYHPLAHLSLFESFYSNSNVTCFDITTPKLEKLNLSSDQVLLVVFTKELLTTNGFRVFASNYNYSIVHDPLSNIYIHLKKNYIYAPYLDHLILVELKNKIKS